MGQQVALEAIGLPLIDRWRERRPRLVRHVDRAARWLREATEPPAGLELRTPDGSTYTGVLIIEHNAPVLLLAVRHPPGRQPEGAPVLTPPPVQRPLYGQERVYGHDRLDPDAPYWDRDSTPYGR